MLGITLLPEYIQSEGIERLLDNLLKRAPVTAISTSPYVMSELPAEQGGAREPPADAEKGLVRLLDRPLWGKREVWIETAPSFEPNLELYKGLRYQPTEPTDLTKSEGPIIDTFIEAAQARGIKIYFQIQSAIPPGYRVQFGGPIGDDTPRLPDGSIPSQRLDKNGSLASPHIIEYGEALIKDLLQRYSTIDGIRIDWPEYPPYFLDAVFTDFGPHVETFANERGFDFERIREEAAVGYKRFRESLSDADLKAYIQSPKTFISDLQVSDDFISLKSQIVSNLLLRYRNAMNEAGGKTKELIPSAFPDPWNQLSGFDYTANSEIVDAISCKHYTMHWPMMMKNYSDALTEKNPNLSDSLVAESLSKSFGAVSPTPSSTEEFSYPEPNEKHPVSLQELGNKQTIAETNSTSAPVLPIAHSYGPTEDFINRAKAVYSVSKERLWVNRYAYLSDEKLEALGQIF
ncbi:MAG: hypothetical protein HOA81_02550, partial [Opitutales bacterium]|nr:hypothetical protein [Opitutales bacterium]